MFKYWDNEVPTEADTGKNIFRYFDEAGKLQISMPFWTNGYGEQKPGKTVAVDIAALVETPGAMEMLRQIIDMGVADDE